jgi:hypothetical protein
MAEEYGHPPNLHTFTQAQIIKQDVSDGSIRNLMGSSKIPDIDTAAFF